MTAATLAILLAAAAPHPPMSTPVPFADAPDLAQTWSCSPRRTCTQISSCDEAVWYLRNCSWGAKLDGDSDGIPCESLCGN